MKFLFTIFMHLKLKNDVTFIVETLAKSRL
jgi:hypothetical protein